MIKQKQGNNIMFIKENVWNRWYANYFLPRLIALIKYILIYLIND